MSAKVVVSGLTGHIEFNEKGFRKNFELKVHELLYFDEELSHSVEMVSVILIESIKANDQFNINTVP